MDFSVILDHVLDLLRQRGRVTYRALKRQFDLDDAVLEEQHGTVVRAEQILQFALCVDP